MQLLAVGGVIIAYEWCVERLAAEERNFPRRNGQTDCKRPMNCSSSIDGVSVILHCLSPPTSIQHLLIDDDRKCAAVSATQTKQSINNECNVQLGTFFLSVK